MKRASAAPSRRPQHEVVFKTMRQRIEDGAWPIGTTLPNEHELGATFSVSRITIRHALSRLERDGYIQRRPYHGTTVVNDRPERVWRINSLDDILRFGSATRLAVLKYELSQSPVPELQDPGVFPRGHYRLEAIRSIEQKRIGFGIFLLPLHIGKLLKAQDFVGTSVFPIVAERADLSLGRATEVIRAMPANDSIARQLECDVGTAILHLERRYFSQSGALIEIALSFYLWAHFQVSHEITS